MELTELQLVIVGLVASALLWVLRLLVSKGYSPSKSATAIALYVISFALALVFAGLKFPAFPPFTDAPTLIAGFLAYVAQLLAIASPVAGMAYLIYNILLKRVLELVQSAVAKKLGA